MNDRLDLLDYYTLLGLSSEASPLDIKRAFRKFARKYHPDRFAGAPEEKLARASQIYRRGTEAYQILTDPVSRRAYDRVLRVGKLRLTADERDRAGAAERAPEKREEKAQPIRSPQALAFYNKAAEAARGGRWRDAWRSMKVALEHEPENPLLRARLAQIETRLRTVR
jgi:curved DNA-binding protein CbpA